MATQIQGEDPFPRPGTDRRGLAQGGHGDAAVEVGGGVPAVVEEHGHPGRADQVGVLAGVLGRGEVEVLEVRRYREGHEALIGRAGLPRGQHSEPLADEQPPQVVPAVGGRSRFHRPIIGESRWLVNGAPAHASSPLPQDRHFISARTVARSPSYSFSISLRSLSGR